MAAASRGRRSGHYGPTPLRMVTVGNVAYLGGGCRRFGCNHTFLQHDMGRPDGGHGLQGEGAQGGQCRGTNRDSAGVKSPCACPCFQNFG